MNNRLPKCKKCGSSETVKNGSNGVGNPKYKCKSCGFSGVIKSLQYSENYKNYFIKLCSDKDISLPYRKLEKKFGISHQTARRWLIEAPDQDAFIRKKIFEPVNRYKSRFKRKEMGHFTPERDEFMKLVGKALNKARRYYISKARSTNPNAVYPFIYPYNQSPVMRFLQEKYKEDLKPESEGQDIDITE